MRLAAFYTDLLDENAKALFTEEERQTLYIQALALLDDAGRMNPAWAEIDYRRGLLYNKAPSGGEPEAAVLAQTAFESALRKNKMHFQARYELAMIHIKKGFADKATSLLEEGLAYPHAPDVRAQYTTLIEHIQNLAALQRLYSAPPQNEQKGTPR